MANITSEPQANPAVERPLLNGREVAEIIGVSLRTFRSIVASGDGPPEVQLPGAGTRFRRADVYKFLDSLRVVRGHRNGG